MMPSDDKVGNPDSTATYGILVKSYRRTCQSGLNMCIEGRKTPTQSVDFGLRETIVSLGQKLPA